jgi:hypothetical protein
LSQTCKNFVEKFVRVLSTNSQNFDNKLSEFRQKQSEFCHIVLQYLTVTFSPSATTICGNIGQKAQLTFLQQCSKSPNPKLKNRAKRRKNDWRVFCIPRPDATKFVASGNKNGIVRRPGLDQLRLGDIYRKQLRDMYNVKVWLTGSDLVKISWFWTDWIGFDSNK